jgi:zinc protease
MGPLSERQARTLKKLVIALMLGCSSANVTPHGPAAAPSTPVSARMEDPTPWDAVRTGRLDNGLRYAVARSPGEKRFWFWLALDVGAVDEQDDQRGFGHLIGHVAHRAALRQARTPHAFAYQTQMWVDWHTSSPHPDETVYRLSMHANSPKGVVEGLDVMRVLAGRMSFDAPTVNEALAELLEQSAGCARPYGVLSDRQFSILLAGSRYAERPPAGVPERSRAVSATELERYYRTWHRPERMVLIAVGPFDDRRVREQIEQRFADLETTNQSQSPGRFPVPLDHPLRVAIDTLFDLHFARVAVVDKLAREPVTSEHDSRDELVEELYQVLLTQRLYLLAKEARSPFEAAAVARSHLTRSLDARTFAVYAKRGQLRAALALLLGEVGRAASDGFSEAELERGGAAIVERARQWQDDIDGMNLGYELVRRFLDHSPMPSRAPDPKWTGKRLGTIGLEEVNAVAKTHARPRGRTITIGVPPGEPAPSEREVRAIAEGRYDASASLSSGGGP